MPMTGFKPRFSGIDGQLHCQQCHNHCTTLSPILIATLDMVNLQLVGQIGNNALVWLNPNQLIIRSDVHDTSPLQSM